MSEWSREDIAEEKAGCAVLLTGCPFISCPVHLLPLWSLLIEQVSTGSVIHLDAPAIACLTPLPTETKKRVIHKEPWEVLKDFCYFVFLDKGIPQSYSHAHPTDTSLQIIKGTGTWFQRQICVCSFSSLLDHILSVFQAPYGRALICKAVLREVKCGYSGVEWSGCD